MPSLSCAGPAEKAQKTGGRGCGHHGYGVFAACCFRQMISATGQGGLILLLLVGGDAPLDHPCGRHMHAEKKLVDFEVCGCGEAGRAGLAAEQNEQSLSDACAQRRLVDACPVMPDSQVHQGGQVGVPVLPLSAVLA